jgi:hypothetical protein
VARKLREKIALGAEMENILAMPPQAGQEDKGSTAPSEPRGDGDLSIGEDILKDADGERFFWRSQTSSCHTYTVTMASLEHLILYSSPGDQAFSLSFGHLLVTHPSLDI